MPKCGRCAYRADSLAEHAEEAGHPLCVVCGWSLPFEERQTCAKCVAKVRCDLADIEVLYARLPGVLVEGRFPADSAHERTGGGEDDRLIGGDALAMLARGGTGTDASVNAPGTAWHGNRDHAADERRNDPPSVSDFLAILEDDWRQQLREQAAGPPSVGTSVAYLMKRLDRMAQAHSEFDMFAADIRGLKARLNNVTGLANRPVEGAACFECKSPLERRYADVVRNPVSHKVVQGGLEDEWTCRECGRVYEQAEYWLAVRSELERRTEESA